MVRIQALISPCLNGIEISHFLQILVIPCLDLLDLVGSTETVEEVDERKTSLDCRKVCNWSQVHYLLYAGLTEHACSGLTTGIYIGVISEDGKCMAGKCTCGYIEYARQSLTCYLVKVRDHQEQTLRSRICSSQSTCCQGAVNGTCCTCLRLHLCNLYSLSEHIQTALCRPLICSLCHNR